MEISQVGKRWFIVKQAKPKIEVEADYGYSIVHVVNQTDTAAAGYTVYDWVPIRKWNLTGTGARRYREEIISVLENQLVTTS